MHYMNEKLTGKFKNRELIEDENGIEYILVLKNVEDELKKEIEDLEIIKNRAGKENERKYLTLKVLEDELSNAGQRLDECREKCEECGADIEWLKQSSIVKYELLQETVGEYKIKDERYNDEVSKLNNLVERKEKEARELKNKIEELRRNCTVEYNEKKKLEEEGDTQETIITAKSIFVDELKEKILALEVELHDNQDMLENEKAEKEEFKGWLVQLKVREEKMMEEKDEMIKQKEEQLKTKNETISALKKSNRMIESKLQKYTQRPMWR